MIYHDQFQKLTIDQCDELWKVCRDRGFHRTYYGTGRCADCGQSSNLPKDWYLLPFPLPDNELPPSKRPPQILIDSENRRYSYVHGQKPELIPEPELSPELNDMAERLGKFAAERLCAQMDAALDRLNS